MCVCCDNENGGKLLHRVRECEYDLNFSQNLEMVPTPLILLRDDYIIMLRTDIYRVDCSIHLEFSPIFREGNNFRRRNVSLESSRGELVVSSPWKKKKKTFCTDERGIFAFGKPGHGHEKVNSLRWELYWKAKVRKTVSALFFRT